MATNNLYPAAQNNIIGTDLLGYSHADRHTQVELKLGSGASLPIADRFLVGTGPGTSGWNKTVPSGDVVGTTDTQILTNKTLGTGTNFALPGQTPGSIFYIDLLSNLSALPPGNANDILTLVGGVPTWQVPGAAVAGVTSLDGQTGVVTTSSANGSVQIISGGGNIDIQIGQPVWTSDSPQFATVNLTDLAVGPNKVVFTDAAKNLTTTGIAQYDQGGTGQSFWTKGDLLYASNTNTLSKLAVGTSGQVLTVTAGGVPAWTAGGGGGGGGVTDLNGLTGSVSINGTTNQITATPGIGVVTLSTPQDIHTGATPTFSTLTLSSLAVSSPVFTNGANQLSTNGVVPEVKGGTNQTTYATGDILYASGVNTLSRLTAGSAGQVLTMAAGVPSWASGGGATGFPSRVSANKNGNQAIPYSTWTIITNWTENYDGLNEFDPVTGIFTASQAGTYICNFQWIMNMAANTTGVSYGMINANGTSGQTMNFYSPGYPTHYGQITWIVSLGVGGVVDFRGDVNVGTGVGVTLLASTLSAGITLRTSIQIQRIY